MGSLRRPVRSSPDTVCRMIKLYATGTTRALPPCILLEEAGAPYELSFIDIRSQDRPEDFVKLQLQGRMPALVDGDLVMDQSVVILIHLAEKFGLFLPGDEAGRIEALRMLMVAATDVMFAHAMVFRLMRVAKTDSVEELLRHYRKSLLTDIARCDEILKRKPYLAGDVSIADLMLYTIVGQYDQQSVRDFGFHALDGWISRIRARPAVRTAEEKCPYLYDVSGTLGVVEQATAS